MDSTQQSDEYDLIEFWRENLPNGESIRLPRLIIGKTNEFILSLTDEAVLFDAITISKEHLDKRPTRKL